MTTTTVRDYIINTYGSDLVVAYFDPGIGYTREAYEICKDEDRVYFVEAMRKAACFFKLPMDASASVDIVRDSNPEVETVFFVELHRASHRIDAKCKSGCESDELSEKAIKALEKFNKSLKQAVSILDKEKKGSISFAKPPGECVSDVPCDGVTRVTCDSASSKHAECIKIAPGKSELRCVQNLKADDPIS